MNLANIPREQKWVIAIVLLLSRKPDCHTVKTYAYPVIQQGRKRVGIARNLPASLFFMRKKEEGRGKIFPILPSDTRTLSLVIELKSNSKFKKLLRNN